MVILLSSPSTPRTGRAGLNTMCGRAQGATNVNGDFGLQSAGMIAHEIGHK